MIRTSKKHSAHEMSWEYWGGCVWGATKVKILKVGKDYKRSIGFKVSNL